MLTIAILILALAALLGILLFYYLLNAQRSPQGVLLSHGAAAAIGYLLLIMYGIYSGEWSPASLGLMSVSALIGIAIAFRNRRKAAPSWRADYVHAVCGMAGFLLLLYTASA